MKAIQRKSWQELRDTGLILFINQILHIFGWAIVFEINQNNKAINCYPARVKFRGFSGKIVGEEYTKISQYMSDNSKELLKECKEE